jgi:hypothetical protein
VAPSVASPGVEPHCPDKLGGVPVELDVHQQDVGPEAAREADGLIAARGLADDLDAVLTFQQRRDAGADQSLRVHDDDGNRAQGPTAADERETARRARGFEISGQDAYRHVAIVTGGRRTG